MSTVPASERVVARGPSLASAKMHKRIGVLIRKAGLTESTPDVSSLLEVMLRRMRTKRDYEDVLGTPEAAEKAAKTWGLSPKQKETLLELQNQKDIFTPNPLLDHALTLMFLGQIVLIAWAMHIRDLLWLFVLLLLVIDSIIRRVKGLSESAGLWLSRKVFALGCTDAEPLSGRVQMKKWQEQSWQLFVHVVATCAETVILMNESWWDVPESCWIPHPFEQRGKVQPALHILYLTQLAVWLYTCFIHRFVDERRKDYFVMYLHHIVTISLVGVSWANGYMRGGILVLYVHDVSDIFVDLLKLSNYLKLEGTKGFFVTEIAYVSCVTGWVYWRLYQFPFRVIYASLTAFSIIAPSAASPHNVMGVSFSTPDLPLHSEMNILLIALLGLHIYWFHLFLMVGYRIITESVRDASRQEYEGDSDGEAGDGGEGSGAAVAGASSMSLAPPSPVAAVRARKKAA